MSNADLIARWETIRLGGGKTLRSAGDDLVAALRAAEEAEEILVAENARWKRRVEIQRDLIIRHEQTIERFLEALMFIKSGDCADSENTARRALGGEP